VIRTESARAAAKSERNSGNYAATCADVFSHLSDLADCFKVDLEKVFRAKEHLTKVLLTGGGIESENDLEKTVSHRERV